MPDSVELPAVDVPPRSGTFIEHDELVLTEEEIAHGNALGRAIDIFDDTDAGQGVELPGDDK